MSVMPTGGIGINHYGASALSDIVMANLRFIVENLETPASSLL